MIPTVVWRLGGGPECAEGREGTGTRASLKEEGATSPVRPVAPATRTVPSARPVVTTRHANWRPPSGAGAADGLEGGMGRRGRLRWGGGRRANSAAGSEKEGHFSRASLKMVRIEAQVPGKKKHLC